MSDARSTAASSKGVRRLFVTRYHREPDVVASAPGRVNLIGEHTDYNGGEVLPIAIDRRTWVAVGMREESGAPRLRALSSTEDSTPDVPLLPAIRQGNWSDYLLGVASPLLEQAVARGARPHSIDVAVASDVPSGAGLSSSAALEVAASLAVATLLGQSLTLREAAIAARHAETSFVGVQCGIMDQFASALCNADEALHIDCHSATTSPAPFRDSVLIFDTAVRRALRDSPFNTRRAECEEALRLLQNRWPALASLAQAEPEQVQSAGLPDLLNRRALHVSRETRRVREAASLLRGGGAMTRDLLVGSHESLRDLYECSRPELDWLVAHADGLAGVRGARLTGAGWGGCAIVVGDEDGLREASTLLALGLRGHFRARSARMAEPGVAGREAARRELVVMSRPSHALLPCGGRGTRMAPVAGALPKEMLLIGGRPLVEHVARECAASGITDLLVIVAPGKESIEAHLGPLAGAAGMPGRIEFVVQHEPRGLADAIRLGRDFAGGGDVAVALPDNLFVGGPPALRQVIDIAERAGRSAVAVVSIAADEATRRGATAVYSGAPRTESPGEFRITHIPEKGAKSGSFDTRGASVAYTGVGRYAFAASLWNAIDEVDRALPPGRELDEIAVLQLLLQADLLTGCLIDGRFLDVGIPAGFHEAAEVLRRA